MLTLQPNMNINVVQNTFKLLNKSRSLICLYINLVLLVFMNYSVHTEKHVLYDCLFLNISGQSCSDFTKTGIFNPKNWSLLLEQNISLH